MEGGTRSTASGTKWVEDAQWARALDEGWDLEAVREVAQAEVRVQVQMYVQAQVLSPLGPARWRPQSLGRVVAPETLRQPSLLDSVARSCLKQQPYQMCYSVPRSIPR